MMLRSDIDTAIAWLECNEGDGGEREACERVAEYLRKVAIDRDIAAASRETGFSRADIRKAIRRAQREQV